MLDAIPLIAMTIIFSACFLYIFSTSQLSDIRKNWDKRRCEVFVIPMAHLVPEDPNMDRSKFSIDNFNYCIGLIIESSVAGAMSPMMNVFSQQVNLTKPVNNSINYLRSSAKSLMAPLNDMMNSMWRRIRTLGYGIAHSYQKALSIVQRVEGIASSALLSGYGVYRVVMNFTSLLHLVISIIIGIVTPLVTFGIIYFFPIAIIPVTGFVTIGGIVMAAIDHMMNKYCVAKGTLVALPNGAWKAVELLVPGEKLADGVVEGVLKTTGKGGSFVSIDGVIISGCHLVFDTSDNKWKPADKHSFAQPVNRNEDVLYCLNTSSRTWTVKGNNVTVLLRDWEELPDSPSIDSDWEEAVNDMINRGLRNQTANRDRRPGRGLVGGDTYVWEEVKGSTKISKISVGDFIKDGYTTFTEVLGIYEDSASDVPRSGSNSAAWVWNHSIHSWEHPTVKGEYACGKAYHLITKSGIFIIVGVDGEEFIRDFTEIGSDKIDQTYDFVLSTLNGN
jgi:hypothetical protein